MSNNTPNYENDLVFPPASAIKRCEKLEKQLKIAVEALEAYQEDRWSYEYEYDNYPWGSGGGWCWAEQALNQIKELDK